MKIIEYSYGSDLNWIEPYAKQFEGKIDGNYIIVPEDIQTGTKYILECGEGIMAYYIDVEYKKDMLITQENLKNDFVGFYYSLTEGEASFSVHGLSYNIERWQYNLIVLDSSLESNYKIKSGTKTFALCIFIRKDIIKDFTTKNNIIFPNIEQIIDPEKNTIVRLDRMSNDSFHLLEELKKKSVGDPAFDLNLVGTVHMLIANYLKKISTKRIIIQTVNQQDLSTIIAMQKYLIGNVQEHFPSIKQLADMAYMSETKFKNLFNKITGMTPNAFFMGNKLLSAKELLEKKQLSISQISDQLHFTNNSYFAAKFKEHFGISPKVFVKEL
ncbi:helix-turn-helix domain-containing protein [Flavobacterium tistrianum]|uniref:helix-turn-helix domain-containing protein n=1 Tax=Flavobacterium tistrianum TaxID=1685414 RepID=UPI0013A6727D|nr:response regulator transcription factor [Flavobacterium tistrianum]KAF2340161.1 helix-turn-helix transcriptional regulator [Flavobacterium tistrianum]